jgi:hypothetical protein
MPQADASPPDADASPPDADASPPDADASPPDADASPPEADAPSTDDNADASPPDADALQLTRWTVTSGSNVQSRGAVVIEAGDHHWQASSQGNGAVDALFRAVDRALADVLGGHPRLVSYELRALAEGPDAPGRVTLRIRPPASAQGERATGEHTGSSESTNIIAASIEAYVQAINALLEEGAWEGAAASAAEGRRRSRPASQGRRAEFDREKARHDTTSWFEQ